MGNNDFRRLHDEAVAAGLEDYVDPQTGYRVTTKLGHRLRGSCCKCECRHCPYEEDDQESCEVVVTSETILDEKDS